MSKDIKDFFASNEVDISITMKGYPTMTLSVLEILNEDATALRQRHIGLPKEKQEEEQHSYNSKLLGHLLIGPIKNPLPGMPDGSNRQEFMKFFEDAKKATVSGDKKRNLLNDIMSLYWRSIQPEEFFR